MQFALALPMLRVQAVCCFLVAVVLAVSSCGTFVTETYLNDSPSTAPPRSPKSVQIYTSGSPSRPHTDVALLEVEQTHGLNQQGRAIMLDHLRARAAQMGCHAVVVGGIRERDGAQPGSGFDLLDSGSTTLHATCIMFTDKVPLSTPPAPKVAPAPVSEISRPSADSGSCRAP
jgi:hypothetical protein